MLSTHVDSTADLMSIALQAEREAIRRYTQLAASMRDGDNESAARLFERMVVEEQEHLRLLLEWMQQENIDESPRIGPISWRDPQISTTYDDEARDPYYSTPYKALAFAVHNEEIAFRFYTHVASDSDNKSVREYAEVLAREELGHAALLRAERRRAYHAEHEPGFIEHSVVEHSFAGPKLNPKNILNEADLLTAAVHIDRHLLDEMKLISSNSPEIETLVSETQKQINQYEKTLNDKAINQQIRPGDQISQNLKQLDEYNIQLIQHTDNPEHRVERLYACCDQSFAFYDAIVESTSDETVMLTAQQLTSLALDRIGI